MSDEWFGNYEILEHVGQGTMAAVYRARQRDFATAVALKVFSRDLAASERFVQRFRMHAQALADLRHEAIVPVFDFGLIDDQPYLTMQLMVGGSLAVRLAEGPLDPSHIVPIIQRIASALAYAHHNGVTHHHVTPSDIFFDERGEAYLADFGLTHLLSDSDAAITRAGGIVGSPEYMAPEQISQGAASPSADMYALGITAFEMLTGQLPFTGDSPMKVVMAHLNDPVPRLDDLRADLPPDVQAVIQRILAKSPDERYASAEAFADDLRSALLSHSDDEQPGTIPYYPGDDLGDFYLDASGGLPPSPPSAPLPAPPAPEPKSDQRRPPRQTPEEREGRTTTPLSSRRRSEQPPDESPPAPSDQPDTGSQDRSRGGFLDKAFGGWSGTFHRASREDDQSDSEPPEASAQHPQESPGGDSFEDDDGLTADLDGDYLQPVSPDPEPVRENVRFTAFHPTEAVAEEWWTFLTYIHLPDLFDQVSDDAQKFSDEMGGTPRAVKLRDSVGLLRGTELLIVPDAPGLTFKPRAFSLTWDEDIERANFRFKADADLIDTPAIGDVSIFAGPVEIAHIPFAIPIVSEFSQGPIIGASAADMHERVFISYSHQNSTIVKATISVLQKLGMEVYADYISLRGGDDWDQRLLDMIEDSDIFQLFWSSQAAASDAVRREWMHALGLNKQPAGARPGVGYIRPVYWEQPMPTIPDELAHIHFMHIPELLVVAERLAS